MQMNGVLASDDIVDSAAGFLVGFVAGGGFRGGFGVVFRHCDGSVRVSLDHAVGMESTGAYCRRGVMSEALRCR
jgi:hypothetical protein